MPAVLRQPESGGGGTQPHGSLEQRSTTPGNDQTRQNVGVHDTTRPVADIPEPGRQEPPFNIGHVRDQDAVAQLLHQLACHLIRRTRGGSVDWSYPVDDHSSPVGGHEWAHGAVERPANDDAATVNRHDADGQHLVCHGVEASHLQVDDGERGLTPRRHLGGRR
jgi:hypothetical protein